MPYKRKLGSLSAKDDAPHVESSSSQSWKKDVAESFEDDRRRNRKRKNRNPGGWDLLKSAPNQLGKTMYMMGNLATNGSLLDATSPLHKCSRKLRRSTFANQLRTWQQMGQSHLDAP
jgi:hypothetical protein